ncbi:MAG: SIMPL domain-containing protein [Candidatus Kapabacteria bacterium]|nr:SIMPL domain-containing protein [Candidatus Kapabacteria bacterium]
MQYRLWAAIAVTVGVIGAALVLSSAWAGSHPRTEKIIVTGLAQQDFVSDLIVWRASFSRTGATVAAVYGQIKADADRVKQYLVSKGIPQDAVIISSVDINPVYRSVQTGNHYEQVFDGYNLNQNVQVESKDVDKVEALSREISELIDAGIVLNSQPPQYYFTKLAELKLDLLAKASRDGTERAEKIAENAAGRLGKLLRADMGIFQITAQNSNEDYSWGGALNTTSKRKTASITVKMEFDL